MDYTVTVKKSGVKTLDDGRDWEHSLPDEWFETGKYRFDGNDYGPFGKGIPPSKREYTLFWFPKKYVTAIELVNAIKKKKRIKALKGCVIELTMRNK